MREYGYDAYSEGKENIVIRLLMKDMFDFLWIH